jgi:two-component system chemotaxis response regulator CheY
MMEPAAESSLESIPGLAAAHPCVLIVDDDAELREGAADGLADAGYEPLVAVDGREALAVLRGPKQPQLILLDLMMPEMNGWEFRDALRADPAMRQIPILVMTASRTLARHPIEADGVLLKPFGLGELLGRVGDLVRRG